MEDRASGRPHHRKRHRQRVVEDPQQLAFREAYAQPAQLQLTCFERNPVVRFSFEFKIGSDKNSALGYRFDDKPGRDNVESRILLGYTVIVIEDKAAVAQFIDELANSNTLYLRIRSLNAGRTTAEFRVAGAAAAVQAALAECPVTPPPGRSARPECALCAGPRYVFGSNSLSRPPTCFWV